MAGDSGAPARLGAVPSRGAGRGGHCPRGFKHRDPPPRPRVPVTLPAPAQTPHKCHQRTSCFRLKRNAECKRPVCQTRAGGSREGVLKAQQGSSNSISNSKSSYTSHFVRAGSLSSEPGCQKSETSPSGLRLCLEVQHKTLGLPGEKRGFAHAEGCVSPRPRRGGSSVARPPSRPKSKSQFYGSLCQERWRGKAQIEISHDPTAFAGSGRGHSALPHPTPSFTQTPEAPRSQKHPFHRLPRLPRPFSPQRLESGAGKERQAGRASASASTVSVGPPREGQVWTLSRPPRPPPRWKGPLFCSAPGSPPPPPAAQSFAGSGPTETSPSRPRRLGPAASPHAPRRIHSRRRPGQALHFLCRGGG